MGSSDRAKDQVERRRESIQKKIHRALPEIYTEFRAAENLRKSLKHFDRTPERLQEIQRQLDEKLESIERRYSGPEQAPKGTFAVETVFREETLASQSESAAVAEYLHWNRHKTPFERDAQQMQAKDHKASKRVQRSFQDFETLRCEVGQVKPFKGGQSGTDHSDFFLIGWGLGLENLSLEELADFADQYCICGGTEHSPDNLKQQRIRFKQALVKARKQ